MLNLDLGFRDTKDLKVSKICIHAIVTGKVQGVYYRASTQKAAQSLSLSGWVKNKADGSVELEAFGEKDHITNLIEWLKQGPADAIVDAVKWEKIHATHQGDFQIKR